MAVNVDWGLLGKPNALLMYAQGVQDRQKNDLLAAQEAREAAQENRAQTRFAREETAAQARTDARSRAVPMIQSGDYTGARMEALKGGDDEFATLIGKMDAEQRATYRQGLQDSASVIGSALSLPPDQREAYALPRLKQLGIDPAQAGIDWTNDASLKAHASEALTYAQQLAQGNADKAYQADREDRAQDVAFRQDQFDETKRRNAEQAGFERQRLGLEERRVAQTAGLGGMTPQQARTASMSLRKEFNTLPDVKNFNDVASSFDIISTLAQDKPSAANDLSMIFAYMKMLDPGSVVREGEFANAQNAAGVPDRIRNAYNRATNGQMLNPNQRRQFVQGARNVYSARRGRYDQLVQQYQSYGDQIGLAGGDIIQPRPAPKSQSASKAATPASAQSRAPRPGEVQQGYRFKGGDPSKASSWVKVR